MTVDVTDAEVIVRLADGRTITTPLIWYPPLLQATADQRRHAVLGPYGIHWPEIDEELSVAGMLAGVRPTYRWLDREDADGSTLSDTIHDGE
ncbi:MAG: DUF2442 domain-containing protein [Acidobacteria bacterium]|nr:DUF2442 domain-containing protein [Acidobacteriota bacterium]